MKLMQGGMGMGMSFVPTGKEGGLVGEGEREREGGGVNSVRPILYGYKNSTQPPNTVDTS